MVDAPRHGEHHAHQACGEAVFDPPERVATLVDPQEVPSRRHAKQLAKLPVIAFIQTPSLFVVEEDYRAMESARSSGWTPKSGW